MRLRLIILLTLLICLASLPVLAEEQQRVERSFPQEMKYPPYPDIWDWQVPNPEAYVPGWLRTYLLDNGDVLIVYTQRKGSDLKGKKKVAQEKKSVAEADRKIANLYNRATGGGVSGEVESKQVTFFGGLTILDELSNVRLMRTPEKPLKLSDGTVAKRLKSDWDNNSGELKDKTYVSASCFLYHDCYIGPAKCSVRRTKSRSIGDTIAEKVVFLLLDKPERWEGAYYNEYDTCDERDHKLKVRVKSLVGSILVLGDGSFLVVDNEMGRIIRFNSDFTTGSPLLNKKLFVFDFDSNNLEYLFMPKINGKDYEDNKGKIKMQEVLDDLYNYLFKLSKEGK